ncbi:phospholipase D family nuclease [Paraburkholderia ginsengisoli]|uniref:phospholipase D n=1 Tax=Paraburkholderia ginsengisoli TaxID=311231 RepID=A0A7T4TCE4_9BURK|nr:phospholipase D family protein [Paraburkholderia ginsengisoli]QQC67864.1 phospholipase D family protein [Paraburkholderia ginsengisoli]
MKALIGTALLALTATFIAKGELRNPNSRAIGETAVQPAHANCELSSPGFSPEGTATVLVDQAIDSAQRTIQLAAYSFNSRDIVARLIAAKRRGVDVQVVVDMKNNLIEDRTDHARAALNHLVEARIPTRTIDAYRIHHDKYMVIDGEHIQTGSFNYTEAAERYNSENALVVWNCPAKAQQYLTHWQSRWEQGVDYWSAY